MKNRRRATWKELLVLCGFWGATFGIASATLDWESLGITLIFVFGIGLPAMLVFVYFYGVKIDTEKL